LVAIGSLSISIQLLNNFPTNSNGAILQADPVTFDRMNYVTNKYLNDVGIFVNWPIDSNNTDSNYIWIADINEVINNTYLPLEIRTNYSVSAASYVTCFIKTKVKSEKCFQIKNSTYSTFISLTSSSVDLTTTYKIELTKSPALEYTYLIGYIDYNINKFSGFNDTLCEQINVNSIIFAKFLPYLPTRNLTYLRNNNAAGYSFYNLDTDLVTVDQLWKTGLVGCTMRGDLGPKLNRDINLVC